MRTHQKDNNQATAPSEMAATLTSTHVGDRKIIQPSSQQKSRIERGQRLGKEQQQKEKQMKLCPRTNLAGQREANLLHAALCVTWSHVLQGSWYSGSEVSAHVPVIRSAVKINFTGQYSISLLSQAFLPHLFHPNTHSGIQPEHYFSLPTGAPFFIKVHKLTTGINQSFPCNMRSQSQKKKKKC